MPRPFPAVQRAIDQAVAERGIPGILAQVRDPTEPFADEVAQRITRPLGPDRDLPAGQGHGAARPHGQHYSKLELPDPDAPTYDLTERDASLAWAAGGMVSTAGDLDRFFGALLGGRLLPPAQQQEIFTTLATTGWLPNSAYGLGISSVRLSCGATVWGNGGAIHGSWSYAYGTRTAGTGSWPTSTATGTTR